MKRPLFIVMFGVAILFFLSSAIAQNEIAVLTIAPDHPKIGETITVTYRTNQSGAKLEDVKEMEAQLLIYCGGTYESDNTPSRLSATMNRKENVWTGSVKLDEPRAKYILFRVRSGDQQDDNNGKCWDALVYGNDDKPVRGACLQRGLYYMGWGYY